ncbi:MAG: acyltransferase domain-containing protein, partial [Thiobacillus sp.]
MLATGVNADGARKTGITIPSRDGQVELMRKVLATTGLSAQDVDFIEAHGTGTQVGDPIETAAIGEVYGRGRETPLPIGSIKANLGHMEAASGMAGLVKAILALQYRALPPQLHLDIPNPHIDFARLNLQPVTEYRPLVKTTPLVAGVNSFGFGGANAHVLLQEYRPDERHAPASATTPPIFLSARSDAALRALASRYAERLSNSQPADYYDIAYAAAYRRERLEKRLALHANTLEQVVEKLMAYAQGNPPEGMVLEDHLPQTGKVAFVYSGNGAQWVGMGLRLMAESKEFAAILSELDVRMQPVAGFSLLAELQAGAENSRLDDTVIAQPLLFAIQVAITRLLKMQGIEPQAVAGHSVGEVAAAWACGALDLGAAIRLIVARSRAQGETRGAGRMAAVGLSVDDMQAVMTELGEALDITVAGINSPKNLTLSGSLADLERVQAHLAPKGIFFRLLDLDYAFHSRQMDPIRESLLTSLSGLETRITAETTFVSTVTGGVVDAASLGAEYWWHNVRDPVRFSDAMTRLSELGCRIFIEIGPHAILQRYIGECLQAAGIKGRVLPTLRKEADGFDHIVETALRAHLLAEQPNLGVYFPQPGRRAWLPNYPWQRERHWHPRSTESLLSIERRRIHPLLGWRIPEAAHLWENVLDPAILPWLADHKVGGAVVFPGAAYAEMTLAAAREWLKTEALAFEEMDIVSPMVFDGEHARTLRFELNDRDGSFRIKSRQRLSHDEWTLHAAGRILQPATGSHGMRIPPLAAADDRIDRETHYRLTATLGLGYGPTFQGLREAVVADDCLQADLECHADLSGDGYLVHPALLDVCYQSLVDFFRADIDAGRGVALLPVKIGRLEYHRAGKPSRFRARLARRSARSVLADFELFDAEDTLLASVSGCRFRAAPLVGKGEEKISRWRIDARLCPHPAESLEIRFPSTQALVEPLRQAMTDQAELRGRWFKEALPLFEALVVSFAFEAFWAIAREGDDALQGLMATSDPYTRWLSSLLRQEGLLFLHEGRWQLAESSDLPTAAEIWRTMLREHDAALPQLVLLGRVGRHLPHLLLNPHQRDAFLDALRRSPVAETLYQDDPAYAGMRIAVEYLLRHFASEWPAHRRLRVLEIADGPSEVPRVLLDALPEDRLDYVLAVPEAVAERQRAEYAHEPNLVIATLDIANWQLTAETHLPDKFDVVLLRHTLHRAVSPKAALNQVRRWLAAGGGLIVAERHPDWSADFLAGLDNDWWHEATGDEAPHSSLAPPAAWAELLRVEGFEDVLDYHEPAADGLTEGAYLLLARAPAQWKVALPVPEPASWLFLVDAASQEEAGHLAARLESQGQRVIMAQSLPQNLDGIDHVVHLRGWGDSPEAATALLAEILENVQVITAHAAKMPRLWFVTRGGALVSNLPATVEPNPQQAALWGFARVVMNEHPALECTLIDMDCQAGLDRLENELLYPDGASEILLADTGRYTLVMQEASEDHNSRTAAGERFRLDFHLPGQLRNLVWLPQAKAALADETIEVEVRATGLNFRDVMYLMGLLPDEAVEKGFAGASLGLEFAGIVSRIGSRVQGLKPDDKVMGFGSACFSSHVVTRADAVARMPEKWSFESAAT